MIAGDLSEGVCEKNEEMPETLQQTFTNRALLD